LTDIFRVFLRKLFPPLFTIRVEEERASLEQGRVTDAFVDDCTDIAVRSGIRSGWIWGHRTGNGLRLEFSSGIPERDRQRFRNTAGFHGL
jgi:hypothetical protein